MEPVVTIDPNIMHGEPCFRGTRVAVRSLFDHLEAGYSIEQFLGQFPTVTRDQVVALLDQLRDDVAHFAAASK